MIVDPWGEIVAEAGTDPGFIIAEIDPALSATMRGRIPALANEKTFSAACIWQSPNAPFRWHAE